MAKDKSIQHALQLAGFYAGGNTKSDNWKSASKNTKNKALSRMKETRNRIKKAKPYE